MSIIEDLKEDEFGDLRGIFHSKLFGKEIPIAINENSSVEFAQSCVSYFNSLSEELIDDLCDASIRYKDHMEELTGTSYDAIVNRRDILSMIHSPSLMVPKPAKIERPVVHLELTCTWEEEHGMEVIIRDGSLIYLSSFDMQSPWYEFENDDTVTENYAEVNFKPYV